MKELIIEIQDLLRYNKYSYREIADMVGVDVSLVEDVDGSLDEEGV